VRRGEEVRRMDAIREGYALGSELMGLFVRSPEMHPGIIDDDRSCPREVEFFGESVVLQEGFDLDGSLVTFDEVRGDFDPVGRAVPDAMKSDLESLA
jgi:hypothetical protein